ncbi:MAG: hypothetical protein R2705_02080 [Ilumatobacteraceae bacterium]
MTNTGNSYLGSGALSDATLGIPGSLTATQLTGGSLVAPGASASWYAAGRARARLRPTRRPTPAIRRTRRVPTSPAGPM